jgi:hypothetical protein
LKRIILVVAETMPIRLICPIGYPRRIDVTALAPERDVATKKRVEKGKRDDKAVKIDRLLADKATFVANRQGITTAEYISELIRGQVEKDFSRMAKEGGHK